MPFEPNAVNTFVTHDEFSSFRAEVREEFASSRKDFKDFAADVQRAMQQSGRTNWSVVIGGVSIFLVMAGMAAALVSNTITAEQRARIVGDQNSVETASLMRQLVEQTAAMDRVRLNQDLGDAHERTKSLAESVDVRFAEMDSVLQREMRLLDEVLQREMGLHVDRLDALIKVNTDKIHKMQDNGH
jgi:hypothetical protein